MGATHADPTEVGNGLHLAGRLGVPELPDTRDF
jgi:hypothetical protein